MKLSTYNPSVQLHNGPDAKVQAFDGGEARTFAAIGDMQGRAAGALVQGIGAVIKQQEEEDSVNVLAASTDYTKRINELLYNQETGLMNTEMQGASGITGTFEEQEKKIRAEVAKQYKFNTRKGAMAFITRAEESAAQRYALVQKHQFKQYNAYRDVTFSNALQLNLQTAADNFNDKEVVGQNIREALRTTTAQYYNQGIEVIKAQQKKVVGAIAQQVINRAYANGDNDLAETYIERYGRVLDPNVLTNFAKAAHDRRLRTMTRSTAETLVSQYGDNIEGLWKAIYEGTAAGTGFDGEKAVQWMRNMAAKGENWGVNTCTKGVNAALEAAGGIPGNTWAPTNYADAQSAGTAFTDRSKLRTGDIVYWDSDKDGKAGHVGVYDAKTGKVYQSGTHGFAAISLDAYGVIGFARPQGRGMTLEEKDDLYQTCLSRIQQSKTMRNYQISNAFKAIDQKLMALHDSGDTDLEHYYSLIDKNFGSDPEMREKGYHQAHYWWGQRVGRDKALDGDSESGSGGSKGGLALGMEHGIVQTLMHREFANEAEYAAWLVSMKPSKAEYERLIKLYDAKKNGTGIFKFDWSGLEASFKEKYPDLDKAMVAETWHGAQGYAIQRINDVRNGGTEPTLQDVIGFLDESMTKINYGSYKTPGTFFNTTVDVDITKAELAAAHIISTRRLPGTDQFEVLKDDGITHIVDAEGLKNLLAPNVGRTGDRFTN